LRLLLIISVDQDVELVSDFDVLAPRLTLGGQALELLLAILEVAGMKRRVCLEAPGHGASEHLVVAMGF